MLIAQAKRIMEVRAMKSKSIITLTLVVLLALLLSFSTLAADAYPKYTRKPTTITMWVWTSNENYSINEWLDEETFVELPGGQNPGKLLLEAHEMVDTAFHLPIMSNVASSISQRMQDYLNGKIDRFVDILALWDKDTIEYIREFEYDNVVYGRLP